MSVCLKQIIFQIYYLRSKTNKNVENEDNERKGYFLTYPAFQGDHCIMHSKQIAILRIYQWESSVGHVTCSSIKCTNENFY